MSGLALVAALLGLPASAAPQPPRFEHPEQPLRSSNGAALLRWDDERPLGELEYELQEGDGPSFAEAKVRYRGSFPSFFVSGRRDGSHYFRVRSRSYAQAPTRAGVATGSGGHGPWSEWSATKQVVVEHHDLGLALGLFGAGAAVFVITGLTLVAGVRSSRERERP